MRSIVLYFAEKNFKIEIAIPSYPQRSIVKQFYSQFPVFKMLPRKCRKKLFQYCDPIEYQIRDRITVQRGNYTYGINRAIEDGIFIVCSGEVALLRSQKEYSQFMMNEHALMEDWKQKYEMTKSVNYSSSSKIGWVLTQYIMRRSSLKSVIEAKIEENKEKKTKKKIVDSFQIVSQGEVFGNLSMISKQLFSPFYAVSIHPETKILFVSHSDIRTLMAEDPTNI